MSDSDWWARQLGKPQQRTPLIPTPRYPQYQQQAPQAPQYQQQAPQQPQYQQQQQQMPQVTTDNLYDAALQWQGGQAARTETQSCPQCGGGHYFSRTNGPSRGPAPAPMCYDCGYNGMFIQGDPAVWQGA